MFWRRLEKFDLDDLETIHTANRLLAMQRQASTPISQMAKILKQSKNLLQLSRNNFMQGGHSCIHFSDIHSEMSAVGAPKLAC